MSSVTTAPAAGSHQPSTGRPLLTPPAVAHLLDSVDDAIVVIAADMRITYANLRARRMCGVVDGAMDVARLVHPDDTTAALAALDRARIEGRAQARLRLTLPTGLMHAEVSFTDHVTTDGVGGVVASFRDVGREDELHRILEGERAKNRRIQTALTDPLTSMSGRPLVLARLQQAIDLAALRGETVAVLFLDLDGFRHINHALGHVAGDEIIAATATKLLRSHPHPDHWGRIGGDEFVLFVPAIDWDEAHRLGERLAVAGRRTIEFAGGTYLSTLSIGFTVVQPHCDVQAHDVVREADIAMHTGKRTGGRVIGFHPSMVHVAARAAEIESQLRSRLSTSAPDFHLQPIVNVETGSTYAVEALVRFRTPSLGLVPADQVVEAAERAGLIHRLDRRMLHAACATVKQMTDPVDGMPLSLSVNVTASTPPSGERLIDRVVDALESTGFEAHRLIIEITESSAIEADATLLADLAMLRRLGVRIAIDDFGTGHSSLGQLERLEVDIVKIDRSFVRDIARSPRRMRYLQSIIQLIDALDVEIVVEGIETDDEYELLAPERARLHQGYLYSKPVAPADLRPGLRSAGALLERLRCDERRPFQPALDWTGPEGIERR